MKRVLIVILSLLIVAGVVQLLFQSKPSSAQSIELSRGAIAYDQHGNGSRTIILIHGSPGTSKEDFSVLGPAISPRYTVYALNMYGFANSASYVSDYSIQSAAETVREFMDAKNISEAVILGYSWGGGVAIEFAHTYPTRTSGLISLSGMGIQEGEITGTYWGEKIRSSVALPFVLIYPGVFAGSFESRYGFMRSFLDSDQRPLREYLSEIDIPALILQGDTDYVIAPWVGEEHARLIKKSNLVYYHGNHHTVYTNVSEIAPAINDFLMQLDRSETQAHVNLFIEGSSA